MISRPFAIDRIVRIHLRTTGAQPAVLSPPAFIFEYGVKKLSPKSKYTINPPMVIGQQIIMPLVGGAVYIDIFRIT